MARGPHFVVGVGRGRGRFAILVRGVLDVLILAPLIHLTFALQSEVNSRKFINQFRVNQFKTNKITRILSTPHFSLRCSHPECDNLCVRQMEFVILWWLWRVQQPAIMNQFLIEFLS